jgi:pimeloyl-ACP methyl ester carboxylesterase
MAGLTTVLPWHADASSVAAVRDATFPSMLWLHGYTMHSAIWQHLWSLLPRYNHIGIDLPGHGLAADLSEGVTLSDVGRQIAKIAQCANARHLIAISFGGIFAIQAACETQDAFDSICLCSPAMLGRPDDPAARIKYGELARAYAQGAQREEMREIWMRSPPEIFTGASAHPALWQQLATIIDDHRWAELSGFHLARLLSSPPPDLGVIQARMTIVIGEQDIPVFKASAEWLKANHSATNVIELANTGHLAILERPDLGHQIIQSQLTGLPAHAHAPTPAPAAARDTF